MCFFLFCYCCFSFCMLFMKNYFDNYKFIYEFILIVCFLLKKNNKLISKWDVYVCIVILFKLFILYIFYWFIYVFCKSLLLEIYNVVRSEVYYFRNVCFCDNILSLF